MLEFAKPELTELKPRIAVVGVGGAGCNAVANMIEAELMGVEFIVANTDAQQLAMSKAATRIQLGMKITQGLGAGARPEIGRAAAEETLDQLETALDGAHMCFIAAGMGGGTGTGAAPVVARAAREKGILTVGVVTKPFSFEGSKRMKAAEEGIAELQKHVDTLIIIPNQNLFLIANANTTFKDAFAMADQVLHQGVRGITDLMIMPGLINLDFADIRTVMSEMGKAMMGTGEATGDGRAIEAAQKAIANPLLDEVSMRGAKGVIINITGGDDLKLMEVDEAASYIRDMVDTDANIIVGSAFNRDLDGVMRVSVVATGIDAAAKPMPVTAPAKKTNGAAFLAQPSIFSAPPPSGGGEPAPVETTPEPAVAAAPVAPVALALDLPVAESAIARVLDTVEQTPEPVAEAEEDDAIDLADAEQVDEPAPANFTFTPVVPPAAPAPVAGPAADPVPEPVAAAPERPLTLFERMMGMSRKPRTPEPPQNLAPTPVAPAASDDDVPGFMRRQVNR
ncbi:cell division protein FtsZ [Sandarakinorhabdus cyanobacteriorum]|uniref:Cell division protein FtsZ n=1 Tax=Sandarakinorhabdus cyanobacteriorum TaxID=1981098 RepID=A0A255Y901_9SPHN|nr:cell division protein FtsZ [Sandarakinorhabdus cyanobacteriorum]OYQ25709.1 cell division protein FtsZ [Sandarakinorhabdus cyanobacteriorum]